MNDSATNSESALDKPPDPAAAFRLPAWLLAALLALATVVVFWPAMSCGFIGLDDPIYVTANPHVQSGLTWEGVKWAFTNTTQGAYWAPLMWLSHMLACGWFGLNPWGHHLMNVLLHAANTALVFLVFRQMTGATWRSLILAALFGWHPLRVESVAWVTERKDVLSLFFGLLAIWNYVRFAAESRAATGKTKWFYGLTLLFFTCSLMSKAMLVTLPCVMLLLDYWPLRRFPGSRLEFSSLKPLLLEKVPLFALAAAASVVTFEVQNMGGAVMTVASLPLGARFANALISYCRYLEKTFWPANLAVFYPLPPHWPLAEVLLAALILSVISLLIFAGWRRCPFLLVGWLWFVGTLVPVIQLVQSGQQAMADRFTYFPSIGLLICIVWGAQALIQGRVERAVALSVSAAAAIVLCVMLTRHQLSYWRNGVALFRHAIAVTRNNSFAHYNLGLALDQSGRSANAVAEYQEALRLKPDDADAHNGLGVSLFKLGRTADAIRQYQAAIRLKPDSASAHNNLGLALFDLGWTNQAVGEYHEAIRLEPDDADAHNNLGVALFSRGKIAEAGQQYQEAIQLESGYAEAHYNLGVALLKQGDLNPAIGELQTAVRIQPDYADAHRILARALFKSGRTAAAIHEYDNALRREPDDAALHYDFGVALLKYGQTSEAIRQYQEAIRLKPDYTDAHYNLANTLLKAGQTVAAIRQYQAVIRLNPDDAEAHNNLGVALFKQRQLGAAIREFQEALRLKSDYTGAQRNLANVLKFERQSKAKAPTQQEP